MAGRRPDVHERIADAALVHRLTGCCPIVALHIPWDAVDDYGALRRYADDHGVRHRRDQPEPLRRRRVPARQPLPSGRRRPRARARPLPRVHRDRRRVRLELISLWLADGTNYPGQDDLRGRYGRLLDGLEQVYASLPPGMRLLVEYKFFEPGFYSTDLPDWGTAALACRRLGPQAQVLVDTGHHPQGTNVEQIVAVLLAEGLLGGFHFNNRKYADDDLIVGSIDPFELFRIMREIARAADLEQSGVHDRSVPQHRGKDRRDDPVGARTSRPRTPRRCSSTRNDWAQHSPRVTCSALTASLLEAFETDVRPLLARLRRDQGLEADPVEAFRAGGYGVRLARERGVVSAESAYEKQ